MEFTRRLFERTNVRGPRATNYSEHSRAIRETMGLNCFVVFDESLQILRALREAGFRLGVISDWQKGLIHFCQELGIGAFLDVVVVSSEVVIRNPIPGYLKLRANGWGFLQTRFFTLGTR